MSGRTILVTGATGGLGFATVREALARGHKVRATGRSVEAGRVLAELGAEFLPCDLIASEGNLPALAEGCHSLIHAAALSASWGPRAEFEAANVEATAALLGAARRAGAERFVFVSSPSIYASFRDRTGIGAGDLPARPPLNHYARTKLAAERMVLAANSPAFATCALRPRALVGQGDRVILPRLAEMARRPRLPLPRGGVALVEPTDLRDAARALLDAEERLPAIGGHGFNISGGRPVMVRDLAARVAEAMGAAPRFVDLPAAPARAIATLLEAGARVSRSSREPVLTRYTLATMGWSQTFDLAPARALIGYEPRHDAVETMVEQARLLAGGAR